MVERIPYGTDPYQFGELSRPPGSNRHPVVIVIHGGFWRSKYDLTYIRPVCESLMDAGLATWNLEYRRIGNSGGGWPGTLEDIAAGTEYLNSIASSFNLDLHRTIALGHSAGGHLALWLAARTKILRGAVSLAGVVDLRRAWELKLSNTVVADFLGGGPADVPDRYDSASPIELLPFGIPQKLFHGTDDTSVPFEISERFVRAARMRGDDAELITLQRAGHFELVDPLKREFRLVRETVLRLVTSAEPPE
jgi:acetyl esterase/lipase